MSDMNVIKVYLAECQIMQLEAKVVELTITHVPNDCVRVELIVYRPRYDRWVFTLAERAKDEENEKEYQRLIEAYEHYEQ